MAREDIKAARKLAMTSPLIPAGNRNPVNNEAKALSPARLGNKATAIKPGITSKKTGRIFKKPARMVPLFAWLIFLALKTQR